MRLVELELGVGVAVPATSKCSIKEGMKVHVVVDSTFEGIIY